MLLSKQQILKYQGMFAKKVAGTPQLIQLEISQTISEKKGDEFNFDEFVGEQKRTSQLYEFRALYEYNITDYMRDKYGLPKQVHGVIYLTPQNLLSTFGTFKLDWKKVKVHFRGSVQIINKAVYLEEIEEYNTCIAVQLFLMDSLHGG